MSKYTTGELAKLCGVSVRTVQYYDSRGILAPSELSEGGRRLYSDEDLRKMRIICFLREIGLSINNIAQIVAEDNSAKVIDLLLEQQEQLLREEIGEGQEKLNMLIELRRELKAKDDFTVESIGDIAHFMEGKKKRRKVIAVMLLSALPVTALFWAAAVLCYKHGIWWPFIVYAAVAIPWGIWVSLYYYKRMGYICPQCHEVFKPQFKEMFWASHTPRTRKLTCPHCGKKSFCVEVYLESDKT